MDERLTGPEGDNQAQRGQPTSSAGRGRANDYMTVSEVAELFHVSAKTIVRWANDRKLPHMVTLGGHRRFSRAKMEALLSQLAQSDQEEPQPGEGDE